jgi:hypothetical protein
MLVRMYIHVYILKCQPVFFTICLILCGRDHEYVNFFFQSDLYTPVEDERITAYRCPSVRPHDP